MASWKAELSGLGMGGLTAAPCWMWPEPCRAGLGWAGLGDLPQAQPPFPHLQNKELDTQLWGLLQGRPRSRGKALFIYSGAAPVLCAPCLQHREPSQPPRRACFETEKLRP